MKYRPEIDGLRALAVVPVMLFHAGVPGFGGGFVGVDVFFVISGYLITTIILAEKEKKTFSLLSFYERRARRILPALFLVMLACIPFAWAFLLPRDFTDFAQSLVAVTTFSSNFLFWSESGYFNAAAELKPLLHTWSLAVEEQYYILFPLFVMLVWPLGKRVLVPTLVLGTLASLALCQWASIFEPNANFYLLPTRGWEILIGALTATWVHMRGVPKWSEGVAQVLSAAGFALIATAIFTFDARTPFPSLFALLPTTGTALIILAAGPATYVGQLLSLRPFVGIGLISYSAYLWHQPLFAFAKYQTMGHPPAWVMAVLFIETFALAYLTWQFVEQPFRERREVSFKIPALSVWAAAASGAALFIGAGLLMDKQGSFLNRLTPSQAADYAYLDYGAGDAYASATRYGTCFLGSDVGAADGFDRQTCVRPDPAKGNILLVGDSHASHLWQALRDNLPDANVMQVTASGCRPVWPLSGAKRCTDLMAMLMEDILPNGEIDQIILAARWERSDLPAIDATLARFQMYAEEVTVLGPTVVYGRELPALLLSENLAGGAARAAAEPQPFIVDRMMRDQIPSDIGYISMTDLVCPEGICQTRLESGVPIIWDHSHFTVPAADRLVKAMLAKGALGKREQ